MLSAYKQTLDLKTSREFLRPATPPPSNIGTKEDSSGLWRDRQSTRNWEGFSSHSSRLQHRKPVHSIGDSSVGIRSHCPLLEHSEFSGTGQGTKGKTGFFVKHHTLYPRAAECQ